MLAATIAGGSGLFVKLIGMEATTLSFFRTLLPAVCMLAVMLYQDIPLFRGNYRIMLVASVVNAFRMLFFFSAFIFTSVSNAIFMLYTWPIFVTIFSIVYLKEKISLNSLLLIGLAFLGMIISASNDLSLGDSNLLGLLAALGAASTYAVTVVIFKKASHDYKSSEIIFYQNLVSIFVFFPFLFFDKSFPSIEQLGLASIYSLIVGLGIFGLFFYGLKRLKASTSSFLFYIELVSALALGRIVLNETLTWNDWLGGGIIVLATVLQMLQKK